MIEMPAGENYHRFRGDLLEGSRHAGPWPLFSIKSIVFVLSRIHSRGFGGQQMGRPS
jgi:hypothetical protein